MINHDWSAPYINYTGQLLAMINYWQMLGEGGFILRRSDGSTWSTSDVLFLKYMRGNPVGNTREGYIGDEWNNWSVCVRTTCIKTNFTIYAKFRTSCNIQFLIPCLWPNELLMKLIRLAPAVCC